MPRYPLPIALIASAACCAWYARRHGSRESGVLALMLGLLAALDVSQLVALPYWAAATLYAARIALLPIGAAVVLLGVRWSVAGVLGAVAVGYLNELQGSQWLVADAVATAACLGIFALWTRKPSKEPAHISLVALIIADAVTAVMMNVSYLDVQLWLARGAVFAFACLWVVVLHLGAAWTRRSTS